MIAQGSYLMTPKQVVDEGWLNGQQIDLLWSKRDGFYAANCMTARNGVRFAIS